jgi:uncharacterized protein DUF4159
MTAHPSPAVLLTAVRRRLLLRAGLRGVAVAFLTASVLGLLLLGLDATVALSPTTRRVLRWLPTLAFLLPVVALIQTRARASDRKLSLLIDERAGQGNVVSTLLAPNVDGLVAAAFRQRAERSLLSVDPGRVIPLDAGRLWSGCVFVALVGAALVASGVPRASLADRWLEAEAVAGADGREARVNAPIDGAPPTLGRIDFTVRPPSYSGLPDLHGIAGEPMAALPGSTVEIRGGGNARVPALAASVIGGEGLIPQSAASGWVLEWGVEAEHRGIELTVSNAGETLERRILPLRQLRDRPPTVTLVAPAEDLVLATPTGDISIEAVAVDDFGISDLTLHWVLSRGSGESFDFDEGVWEWDRVRPTSEGGTGLRLLSLDELELQAGDVLHVRAVATDENDVTGPGIGVSATRQIRISREDDLSDVTTLVGFPIEREREPLLSQRMIILLTEELIDSAAGMNPDERLEASRDLADEQARLRARIGEQIFSRATGAMQDPEAHLDFEEGEAEVFLDELEAMAEQGPVIDPETGIASIANVDIPAHEHDSDPIIAINRSLLTVYNYMWDAERRLRAAALAPSLVPQHLALDELQLVRNSERVFARGRVTVAPIDVPTARGTGDIDDATPTDRTVALPTGDVAQRVAAAIDSLLSAPADLSGRVASVQISSLALELLLNLDDPTPSEVLARAAERAAERDAPGAVSGLRQVLRSLQNSDVRAVPTAARPPSSLAAARYVERIAGTTSGQARSAEARAAEKGLVPPFTFATVRYESGDWDSAPLVPANLVHSLALYTDLPVEPAGVEVDLSSPQIFDFPFLYLTGHLPVFFGEAEGRNLVDFVNRGGFVFIDDHNHDIDGAFHRSVTAELRRLFGSDRLTAIPNDHELYSSFFEFDEGPPITGHELSGWGDGLIHRELFQIESAGRVGVLYSNKDYSSEWSYHADNKRFLAIDNTRFGVNILVYALTR